MIASNVDIRPETFQLASRPMPAAKKRKIRHELIIEYIRSKPNGKRIQEKELMKVAKFNNTGTTGNFVRRMVKHGVIERHPASLKGYYYTVPGDVKIIKPVASKPAPPPAATAAPAGLSVDQIEQKAMSYAWHYGNDLREFVKWLRSDHA